ncbi:MAG TPA: alpha/beta hydrolase [Baekduia sp.]|nr:alpha/beta hydrolase [Baekduia sp.]
MPMLDTSTGPVAYDERGAGDPVVLLPSGAHDHHDYDALRALLPPDRFRTIALDWPAHGASPPGDAPASATRFADLAEELVAAVAPEGAVVVGNSVGGFSAARLAIRRPELVKGLVLIDSGGFAGRPPHVRIFCALMARPGFLRRIYPSFSARYMRARTDADRRARDTGVATTRADPGLRAVAELWRSFASPEHDLRADAHRITAPTLMIWGRRDPVIPVKLGRQVAQRIAGARLVVLDTGHVPHTTDPEAVAAELVPFAAASFAEQREAAATT